MAHCANIALVLKYLWESLEHCPVFWWNWLSHLWRTWPRFIGPSQGQIVDIQQWASLP
jgi:hypothetical protein